jgi:hypothetical protein
MRAAVRPALALVAGGALLLAVPACRRADAGAESAGPAVGTTTRDTAYAALVARLGEPAGFFDTDNLISNETDYLRALDGLRALDLDGAGGAYLGVGPDQNFSYIAELEPRVAFVLDIRRDNMLLHLLYRALFVQGRTRAEYLAHLFGRPAPARPGEWRDRPLDDLLAWIDATPADSALVRERRAPLHALIASFGVPLSAEDTATIDRFHGTFVGEGLGLRFNSFGRLPQPYYPTYRDLLAGRDAEGEQASYLTSEARYRAVRRLQERGLIVPVVGDFAGPTALRAIGDELRARGERVTAFYTSNVEYYLWQDGSFGRFAGHVAALPWHPRGAIVRSHFSGGFRRPHPRAVPGHPSTQLVQRAADFVRQRGAYGSYWEMVTAETVGP